MQLYTVMRNQIPSQILPNLWRWIQVSEHFCQFCVPHDSLIGLAFFKNLSVCDKFALLSLFKYILMFFPVLLTNFDNKMITSRIFKFFF